MQFSDLGAQYGALKTDIDKAIQNVLDHSQFISGPEVRQLERELSNYLGVKHCITCANGTDALTLSLKAWNIGVGDAVFVPSFTFVASAEAASLVGATPVFCDVEAQNRNISVDSLRSAVLKVKAEGQLTPRVIVAVDLFGLSADYDAIRQTADEFDLLLLEDGAQSFGASYKAKKCCSFGDISTTSFFPAKPLGCYGDGGAIFTDNDEWADILRSLCVHGKGDHKYHNIRVGTNSRLDTIQAAVLQAKLPYLDAEIGHRSNVASRYSSALSELEIPVILENYDSSWAQFTILLPNNVNRNEFIDKLKSRGVPTIIHFAPLHRQPAYDNMTHMKLPVSEDVANRIISLPISGYITDDEVETVILAVMEALN